MTCWLHNKRSEQTKTLKSRACIFSEELRWSKKGGSSIVRENKERPDGEVSGVALRTSSFLCSMPRQGQLPLITNHKLTSFSLQPQQLSLNLNLRQGNLKSFISPWQLGAYLGKQAQGVGRWSAWTSPEMRLESISPSRWGMHKRTT